MSIRDDLNFGLAAFGYQLPDTLPIDQLAARLVHHPSRNATIVVAASSVLFYLAEKGHNPKVNDIYDAMVFCSTCLSVGYSDIFARTSRGKLIATLLMTWGPALASKTLDGPALGGSYHTGGREQEMISILKQILGAVEANNRSAD
jgi:voltage-gated potassium channel